MAVDMQVFLRVMKTIVGVLGITGNSIVCYVIYKVQSMHSLTNAFIFSQGVADLFGSLVILLGANVPVSYQGPLGEVLCLFWTSEFILWIFFCTSTLNLTALTLERYFAIVFPFRYQATFGRTKAIIAIVTVWLLGTIIAAYVIVNVKKEGDQCYFYSISGSEILSMVINVLVFFLPLAVMLACYSHIAVTLKKSAGAIGPQPGPRADGDPASITESHAGSLMRARRNTLKTLFIVFIAFVVCWTPSITIFTLFNLGLFIDVYGPLFITSRVFLGSNSCVNPIIYALKYRSFQDGLRKVLGLPPRQERGDNQGTTST